MASHGHEQIDIVEAHGVPSNCLVVGHTGDRDDIEYQKSIAARDAFVGLDRFGLEAVLLDQQLEMMGHHGGVVHAQPRARFRKVPDRAGQGAEAIGERDDAGLQDAAA